LAQEVSAGLVFELLTQIKGDSKQGGKEISLRKESNNVRNSLKSSASIHAA